MNDGNETGDAVRTRQAASRWWLISTSVLLLSAPIIYWHADLSVWHDEAWVVLMAGDETPIASWSRAIEMKQPAATGHLLLMYMVDKTGLTGAWPFRVTTAAFGVTLLIILAHWGWRWSGSIGLALCIVVFLLLCPQFVRYLTEIKQYLPAATLIVILIASAERWVVTKKLAFGWLWLGAALVGLSMAYSPWFAIAGTGALLLGRWLWLKDWHRLSWTIAFQAVIAVLAAVIFLSFARHLSSQGHLQQYWADQYLSIGPSLPGEAWRFGARLFDTAWIEPKVPGTLLMGMACAGWVLWLLRYPWQALGVALTIAMTLAASTAGKWPAAFRVNLPIVVLLHVCLMALPLHVVGLATGWTFRSGSERNGDGAISRVSSDTPPRWFDRLDVAALGLVVLVGGSLIYRARNVNYEVAEVNRLMIAIDQRAQPGQRVLLDMTAMVSRDLYQYDLPGDVRSTDLSSSLIVTSDQRQQLKTDSDDPVLIGVGHYNVNVSERWRAVGEELSMHGEWRQVWDGKMVAIFEYRLVSGHPQPEGKAP